MFVPTKFNLRYLTDEAGQCMRHILYNYGVPLSRFPGLLSCFAVLLLGRALVIDELPSLPCIRNRLYRLQDIDKELFKKSHAEKFSPKGFSNDDDEFPELWYTTTDDAELKNKTSSHQLLMTSSDEEGYPFYEHLTSIGAHHKNSDGNADLNAGCILVCLPLSSAALYGGNVSDNAAEALLEGQKTFQILMDKVGASDDPSISSLTRVNGVIRKALLFGDPFHVDNLLMKWGSIGACGETERGNHSMFHHRQLLQNLHSIHTDDPVLSKAAADAALEQDSYSI